VSCLSTRREGVQVFAGLFIRTLPMLSEDEMIQQATSGTECPWLYFTTESSAVLAAR
jgi:hypothetical protein